MYVGACDLLIFRIGVVVNCLYGLDFIMYWLGMVHFRSPVAKYHSLFSIFATPGDAP